MSHPSAHETNTPGEYVATLHLHPTNQLQLQPTRPPHTQSVTSPTVPLRGSSTVTISTNTNTPTTNHLTPSAAAAISTIGSSFTPYISPNSINSSQPRVHTTNPTTTATTTTAHPTTISTTTTTTIPIPIPPPMQPSTTNATAATTNQISPMVTVSTTPTAHIPPIDATITRSSMTSLVDSGTSMVGGDVGGSSLSQHFHQLFYVDRRSNWKWIFLVAVPAAAFVFWLYRRRRAKMKHTNQTSHDGSSSAREVEKTNKSNTTRDTHATGAAHRVQQPVSINSTTIVNSHQTMMPHSAATIAPALAATVTVNRLDREHVRPLLTPAASSSPTTPRSNRNNQLFRPNELAVSSTRVSIDAAWVTRESETIQATPTSSSTSSAKQQELVTPGGGGSIETKMVHFDQITLTPIMPSHLSTHPTNQFTTPEPSSLKRPFGTGQSPTIVVPRSHLRPTISASLELPSHTSASSADTSRTHSPKSASSRSLISGPTYTPVNNLAHSLPHLLQLSASGSQHQRTRTSVVGGGNGSPRTPRSARSGSYHFIQPKNNCYKVHWFDEIKLLPHIHPLKRGIGMAENISPVSTLDGSPRPSISGHDAAATPLSPSSSTSSIGVKPLGFFRSNFDSTDDLILLTGATSFLGAHLLYQLLTDQDQSGGGGGTGDEPDSQTQPNAASSTPTSHPVRPIVCLVRPALMSLSTVDQDAIDGENETGDTERLESFFGFPSCTNPIVAKHLTKLKDTFELYGLEWQPDLFESRLVLLPGDVALPHFGVDSFHYHQLVQHTHTIFHLAGEPGLSTYNATSIPYSALKYSMVESTKRVLEFSMQVRRKILVYVSSLDLFRGNLSQRALDERAAILDEHTHAPPNLTTQVAGSPSNSISTLSISPRDPFTHSNESTVLATAFSTSRLHGLANGFLQSKWVCENLLRQAYERGAPILIFRLGELCPASRSARGHGYIEPFMKLICDMTQIGVGVVQTDEVDSGENEATTLKLPEFNLMPVDRAADIILFISATYYQIHPPPTIPSTPTPSNHRPSDSLSSITSANFLHYHHRITPSTSSVGSTNSGNSASGVGTDDTQPPTPTPPPRSSFQHQKTSSVMFTSNMLPPAPLPVFHIMNHSDTNTDQIVTISLRQLLNWSMEYGYEYSPQSLTEMVHTLLSERSLNSSTSTSTATATPPLLSPEQILDFFQISLPRDENGLITVDDERTQEEIRMIQIRLGLTAHGRQVEIASIVSREKLVQLTTRTYPTLDRDWFFCVLEHLVDRGLLPPPPLAELDEPIEGGRGVDLPSSSMNGSLNHISLSPPEDNSLVQSLAGEAEPSPISNRILAQLSPSSYHTAGMNSYDKPDVSHQLTPTAPTHSAIAMTLTPDSRLVTPITDHSSTFPTYLDGAALPTPSAFMSPPVNSILSFLTPSTNGTHTPNNDHTTTRSPTVPINLSFNSLHSDSSPAGSGHKSHSNSSIQLPPFHDNLNQGSTVIDHHSTTTISSSTIFSTPSTPPTIKAAVKVTRLPPNNPSRRASLQLPHITTAALRRQQQTDVEGSAPIMKSTRAIGLSSLLSAPSPILEPINNSAIPGSAPFSSLTEAHPLDMDSLQLALDGESSLMQALNSAAKKCAIGRRPNTNAQEHEVEVDEPTPQLGGPTRTLSAPSPLAQLSTPMLARATSTTSNNNWATPILPNLYLGNARHAFDLSQLRQHGITHIINVADDVPNYHPNQFIYKNLHVADSGQDRGIKRVFKEVHKFVINTGFIIPNQKQLTETDKNGEEDVTGSIDSTSVSTGASPAPSPPVRILLHCAKGANRSVTILLVLLMYFYPDWTLDRAHHYLLTSGHPHTCPFPDNRATLIQFDRQRFGQASMTDKDFLTRFAHDD